jgi:membrane protein DedA with SNARE-associated domain
MHEVINLIVWIVWDMWYTGIFLMMVLESSFFPFPSEVAMIPAWYLASTWEMNFSIALIIGTLWALLWAVINYALWYYLWEKVIKSLIKKYGKYFFITAEHYEKTERYFKEHGIITTFLARFITVIRQLISLPAWVFKINIPKFLFYTWLGAWLWNLALMVIGYVAWENKELIKQYSKELLIWGIILIIIVWVVYYLIHKKRNEK